MPSYFFLEIQLKYIYVSTGEQATVYDTDNIHIIYIYIYICVCVCVCVYDMRP